MRRRKVAVAIATSVVVAAFYSPAVGATPRGDQYDNDLITEEAPGVTGQPLGEEAPTLMEAAGGALPFTGFHALLVLVGGAAAAATGLALRRIGRDRDG